MGGPSRIRSWLEQLLHTHDTPQRTALAYALGVFLGFSPILGLRTVLGLALAFVFRLNRVAVVLGVYSNLPWLVPAYYTLATIAGAAVLQGCLAPTRRILPRLACHDRGPPQTRGTAKRRNRLIRRQFHGHPPPVSIRDPLTGDHGLGIVVGPPGARSS